MSGIGTRDEGKRKGGGTSVVLALATGLGLGLSPVASGTVGTLWGLLLVWPMPGMPVALQVVYALVLTGLAIPICDRAERVLGRKDDGRIVADEFLTFPVGLIALPLHPAMLIFAFLTNRFFDILKPPPAAQAQRLPGGVGIVLDDLAAAAYSLVLNHLFYRIVLQGAV